MRQILVLFWQGKLMRKVALSQVARASVRTHRKERAHCGLPRRDAYGKATRNLNYHQIEQPTLTLLHYTNNQQPF